MIGKVQMVRTEVEFSSGVPERNKNNSWKLMENGGKQNFTTVKGKVLKLRLGDH